MNRLLAVLVASLIIAGQLRAATGDDRRGLDFFEAKIRPILVNKCYECHSAGAAANKKLKGGLMLDTRAGIRKGGETGPAVVPGKVDQSHIIKALRHESVKMPPKSKLADPLIADFVKWIEMGAPDPRDGKAVSADEVNVEEGKAFWAFQPLKQVPVPDKINGTSRNAVDQFILRKLNEKKITPNDTADAHTLIRRAYFNLTGLPPKPEDVDAFTKAAVKDLNKAYADLVDSLLATDHYGEKWARHWLDLARFAESNGYAFDKDRANAFQYRDWVIRALNADLPYDEFVRLQIAGDILKPNTLDGLAATGFVVAGPFTTQQTQKERERSRYEQLDDIIHTIGTGMLGMTLGCARCHTHKYDPFPMHDYYRMAASFAEVGFTDAGIDLKPEIYEKAKAEYDKAHTPLVEARTKFEKEQLATRFETWYANRPVTAAKPMIDHWYHIGPFTAADFNKVFAEAFPPETEIDLKKTYNEGKLKWRRQPKWTDGKVHNTLSGGNAANYLYRTITAPEARTLQLSLGSDDGIKLFVNGVEVLANNIGRGAAADQETPTIALKKGKNDILLKITNGGGPSGFYFQATNEGAPEKIAKILAMPLDQLDDKAKTEAQDWYKTIDEEWIELNKAVVESEKKAPKPNLTMIYSAKKRGSTYNFGANTYKVYHLVRGNADNKQDVAEPGFLRALMKSDEVESRWRVEEQDDKQTPRPPRAAVADWLTDAEYGAGSLLARVIVNRLWYYHFGRGIVATPSDFGTRGERPTHPELLDYLAGELIKNNWQLKPIHKLIMTSATYMQGNTVTDSGQRSDPENMYYWRRESRRLQAELIRDSLLDVTGQLDTKMYGKGSLNVQDKRRSVYLTVKRSRLIPMLQLFDAPDAMQSVGNREVSTVAPQALTMINSPIVRSWAQSFATRVRPAGTSFEDAVKTAYQLAYARPATDDEVAGMTEFIKHQTAVRGGTGAAESLALRDFCQIILCSNEFVYVD